ncbi:MAG: hypothetical protein ACW98Y_05825 [Candidatus Thorarchaeota archaeon]|jgi:hypothetical protein
MKKKAGRKEKGKKRSLGYWIPTRHSYPPSLAAWMTRIEKAGKKKRKTPRALKHPPPR